MNALSTVHTNIKSIKGTGIGKTCEIVGAKEKCVSLIAHAQCLAMAKRLVISRSNLLAGFKILLMAHL